MVRPCERNIPGVFHVAYFYHRSYCHISCCASVSTNKHHVVQYDGCHAQRLNEELRKSCIDKRNVRQFDVQQRDVVEHDGRASGYQTLLEARCNGTEHYGRKPGSLSGSIW